MMQKNMGSSKNVLINLEIRTLRIKKSTEVVNSSNLSQLNRVTHRPINIRITAKCHIGPLSGAAINGEHAVALALW